MIKYDKDFNCEIAGFAIEDIKENDYENQKYYTVCIGFGRDKNGNNLPLINVSVWGRKVDIRKGDKVFACGTLKETIKNDKKFYYLTADFIAVENSIKNTSAKPVDLKPVDDDSLPF